MWAGSPQGSGATLHLVSSEIESLALFGPIQPQGWKNSNANRRFVQGILGDDTDVHCGGLHSDAPESPISK